MIDWVGLRWFNVMLDVVCWMKYLMSLDDGNGGFMVSVEGKNGWMKNWGIVGDVRILIGFGVVVLIIGLFLVC